MRADGAVALLLGFLLFYLCLVSLVFERGEPKGMKQRCLNWRHLESRDLPSVTYSKKFKSKI
jgi:hypothetical protein